jgi:hypothetical protein
MNKCKKYAKLSQIIYPSGVTLNTWLCESHYERLLDIVRAVMQFGLPTKEEYERRKNK